MAVRQIYGKQKGNCSRNGGKKGTNKRVEILAPHTIQDCQKNTASLKFKLKLNLNLKHYEWDRESESESEYGHLNLL